MGTWGVGPFDDDTAMDFIDEPMARSPVHVRSELDRVVRRIPKSGEVNYPSALQAIAAAVLLGGCSLPPEIATWRRSLAIHVTAELAAAALLRCWRWNARTRQITSRGSYGATPAADTKCGKRSPTPCANYAPSCTARSRPRDPVLT